MPAQRMCLVCVFDGLRPDFVRPDWTPNLWKLRARGVWFSRSHCVFPSVTRVNSAALATGSFPGSHGLESNTIWRPAIEPGRRLSTAVVADLRRLGAAHGRVVRPPTLGEVLAAAGLRTVAIGTGSGGGTLLLHPEAARSGGMLYHYEFTEPVDLADKVAGTIGPAPAGEDYGALAMARVEYAARALTDVLIPQAEPAAAAFWITVPDGLHHRFGLGAPASVAGIKQADDIFGRMLDRLAAQGLSETTDVLVTSDHGYATVSGHLDVASELVRAGLKRALDSTDVVLCADGGACLLYTEPEADLEALASFLLQQRWVSAVFSRAGTVPGTLPLASVNCEGPSAPPLLATLAWDARTNEHGVPGSALGTGGIAVGAGDHGGISPFEMRNTLIAAGPHFRAGVDSDVPCGIVDIAPTVLRCLGVERPAVWDGRVLDEALVDGREPAEASTDTTRVDFGDGVQELTTSLAGGVRYTYSAGILRAD